MSGVISTILFSAGKGEGRRRTLVRSGSKPRRSRKNSGGVSVADMATVVAAPLTIGPSWRDGSLQRIESRGPPGPRWAITSNALSGIPAGTAIRWTSWKRAKVK